MAIKSEFSIKDLEALSGIKAHTIRIWEQRYNLLSPKRTDTNIRLYDCEDLRLLLNIAFLYNNGRKISRIAEMTLQEIYDKVMAIAEINTSYQNQVDEMKIAMVEMNDLKFEKIICRCSIQFGFADTMEKVIYPFLHIVGVMWVTKNIHPAQEHFITNLIRQKVIVAIDGQANDIDANAQKFLLFLPEKETHEISLLYLDYLLKKNKKKTVYLGFSVPLDDLSAVAAEYKPDFLYTVITSANVHNEGLSEYLRILSQRFKETKIIVSGAQTLNITFELPENVSVIKEIGELHSKLKNSTFIV